MCSVTALGAETQSQFLDKPGCWLGHAKGLYGRKNPLFCFFSFEMYIPWPVAPSPIFKAGSTAWLQISASKITLPLFV